MNMKKILSIILCMVLLLGIFSVTATTVSAATTSKTSITKVVENNDCIDIKWEKVSKSYDGYEVQISTDKKFKKNVTKASINSYKKTAYCFKKFKINKTYYSRIRTYKKYMNKKMYSDWSKIKTFKTNVGTTTFKSHFIHNKSVVLRWNRASGLCDGYQIQHSVSKNFNEDVLTINISKSSITSIGVYDFYPKTYYGRIRVYKKVNNKKYYGKWSNIDELSINLETPSFTKASSTESSIKLSWNKIIKLSNTFKPDGYQVQYGELSNFDKTKRNITIKDIDTKSINISKLKNNTTYCCKIRSYVVIMGKKYYSSWSNIIYAQTQ